MAAADVDAIWEEMQREQHNPRRSAARTTDISTLQRQRPNKAPTKKLDSSLHWMQSWSASLKKQTNGSNLPESSIADAHDPIQLKEPPTTLIDAVEAPPTETPETFLAYLQRDINCLGEDSYSVRLQSMQKLEAVLVGHIDTLPTDIVDAAADAMLKPLLKRMKDKAEKCRELSVRILRSLVENTSDLSAMLPYIFPTLVTRLGSEDLDGVAHLPEVMRPAPEQKPTEIASPVEKSEEVRRELATFIASLLARCNQTQVYSYVDEATGLLRAQAMDPFHEVKSIACDTMIAFCYNHSEMLLHFAEPLGRSLTSCLLHNHAKLRIQALRALTAVLWCGVWKHNFEVFQNLMAWQDPNKVPIKAFYENVTSVNYMSTLSFDRHPAVRRFWFETLAYWLLRVPDKVDHEPYIFPYLLSGLCDENDEIALEVFWLIEKCGELYETEKEEELRKTKQYGFDCGWTYEGRAFVPFPLQGIWGGGGSTRTVRRTSACGPDLMGKICRDEHHLRDRLTDLADAEEINDEVDVPVRDYAWPDLRDLVVVRALPRPRLGSRCYVRTHTRRYIKATFNDVVDFRDCTALNAGRLLCMSLAYTEEGITEWLQPMLAALCKFYSGRAAAAGNVQVTQTFDAVCKLLGAFCDPISYWEQLKSSLSSDSPLDMDQRVANIHILALCIEGSVHSLMSVEPPDPDLGMGRLAPVIPELICAMHMSDMLLCPTEASRSIMWQLLLAFLEPLRPHLHFAQVSQLLFVALALASKPPPDASTELAGGSAVADPALEDEELVDSATLQRVLASLGTGIVEEEAPQFDLDSLDDEPCPSSGHASAAMPVETLFKLALPEALAHVDDSFQVFRSIVYLSPLSVLLDADNTSTVLDKFAEFCRPASGGPTRAAAAILGVQLAFRCAKWLNQEPKEAQSSGAGMLTWRLFRVMGRTQLDAQASSKNISYAATMTAMTLWRRYFLTPCVDPREALFHPNGEFPSVPLQLLSTIIADQELYKKLHRSLEDAEISVTGKDKDDWAIAKTKQLREEADHRANVIRCLAASNVLVVIRRLVAEGRDIPWLRDTQHGSISALFRDVASLFRRSPPTMDPPFVKPSHPTMIMYAAEILHVLLRLGDISLEPFCLQDDAAKAILRLQAPGTTPTLRFSLQAEERETLATEFITTLVDLNLSLPPDPEAKHAPASLADDAGDEIVLGWDAGLKTFFASACGDEISLTPRIAERRAGPVPSEIGRLLVQSLECLRWNAALALYTLGLDLCVTCQDGFQRSLAKWMRRSEQAKVIVVKDVLRRAKVMVGSNSSVSHSLVSPSKP